jgi:hypothetical protein
MQPSYFPAHRTEPAVEPAATERQREQIFAQKKTAGDENQSPTAS